MDRKLAWLVTPLLLACIHLAEAQKPKIARIGFLVAGSSRSMATRVESTRQGLHNLGYIEGRNVILDFRYSEGKIDRIPALAAELIRSNPDVIVTYTTSVTQEVIKASRSVPVVMAGGGDDPVRDGLITSYAKPGGNVTGLTSVNHELTGKQLELLKEAFPKVSRVAAVWNPEASGPVSGFEVLRKAAPSLRVQIESFEARKSGDVMMFSRAWTAAV